MKTQWPKQSKCLEFYGEPNPETFEKEYCVIVPFPWKAVTFWNNDPEIGASVHHKCAESLTRIFNKIWILSGKSQKVIENWGLDKFGGGYCHRNILGSTNYSMHAYGAAIDFDPNRNRKGDFEPRLMNFPKLVKIFKDEGWIWGGNWHHIDGMHFQAAIV